jgi:hypothetical protein
VVVPGRSLQPKIIFASKAGVYPSDAPFMYTPLLAKNITPGLEGLPGTNTIYLIGPFIIYEEKSFESIAQVVILNNIFDILSKLASFK